MEETKNQENSKDEAKKQKNDGFLEEPQRPLTFALEDAKASLGSAIGQIRRQYGIPAFMLEGILTGILADVRADTKQEMRRDFDSYLEEFRKAYGKENLDGEH